ncbi:MAG: DNA polymerase III subunit beta [Bacteroidia bacterium]|nr:DNA polymerase III subunit beta [Bacteroidia bacterium]MCO5254818.1 DNA polymerase III subunit beta [Bacteroidota bacterium]MCZ2130910.1 DNA polymerase III subunit beta [Bacteroidia bacterium]
MKFIVPSSVLLQKLQSVNGAILSKPVIPAIENFYFNLAGGKLAVTTTDLETYMQETLDVQSSEDVKVCVPAKSTIDILREFSEQPLNFTVNTDNNSIELSTTSGRYKLPGESAEEFPEVPEMEISNSFSIPANILIRGINKTLFATGTDELRLALTGVYFEISNDSLNLVATDANRLVKYTNNEVAPGFNGNFILPKKSLNLLKSSLPNDNSAVTVNISDSNVRFTCGSLVLTTRIMDEKFPDYKMVVPQDNNNILTISRQEVLNAVRRTAIFANQQTHQIRLKVVGSQLSAMAEDTEKESEAHEALACEYDGVDMEIGFNSKFLTELLANLENSEVQIKLSSPSRAGLIIPKENEAHEDILMLIMPMMLNNY